MPSIIYRDAFYYEAEFSVATSDCQVKINKNIRNTFPNTSTEFISWPARVINSHRSVEGSLLFFDLARYRVVPIYDVPIPLSSSLYSLIRLE